MNEQPWSSEEQWYETNPNPYEDQEGYAGYGNVDGEKPYSSYGEMGSEGYVTPGLVQMDSLGASRNTLTPTYIDSNY